MTDHAVQEFSTMAAERCTRLLDSAEQLLAAASRREPLWHSDSKSGACIERVELDGHAYIVKHLDVTMDWTLRTVGDFGGANRAMWTRGLLARMPDCLNQPIVAVARGPKRAWGGEVTVLIMEDVGQWMVPAGDDPIPLEQHLTFMSHMAALHATFWNAGPEIDLIPASNRLMELSPWLVTTESELGSDAIIPSLVGRGWATFADVAPHSRVVAELAFDPSPLVAALELTPSTLVHGNWKLGNLGTDDGGRTVVIDWESPGRGAPCSDLAWYLAINSARLPQSKEATAEAYRCALENHGIDTAPWWDDQLRLALLGGIVQFGWEKALGGPGDELDWWLAQADEGARVLAVGPGC